MASVFQSRRQTIIISLLVVCAILLILEIIYMLPTALQRWYPFDYGQYIAQAKRLYEGGSLYDTYLYYPMTTVLWIFLPLALLPDWFRFVWILGSFISCLVIFKKQGVWLFLFVPLWFVASDGMIDGWLLIPLAWLLANRPYWAGVGGALVLFKPQLGILAVGLSVLRWMVARDWKNLGSFGVTMVVLLVPTFIVAPNWVSEMLAILSNRISYTTTLMGGSLWSWTLLGFGGQVFFVALALVAIFLAVRAFRNPSKRVATVHLMGLLFLPVFYASNQIMALPTLHTKHEIILVVALSLLVYFLHHGLIEIGGWYALIPLTALYFQSRQEPGNHFGDLM